MHIGYEQQEAHRTMTIAITGEGDVTRLISQTVDVLGAKNAWFNPDLEIRVDGSNVSMISRSLFGDLRGMIRVPVATMPVLDDFDITVSGNDLQCNAAHKDVDDTQVRLMNLILETYNALGKIPQWKSETPWFSLTDHPDALAHLMTGRPQTGRLKELERMRQDGQWDAMAQDTFIGARKFNLSESHCKMIGRDAPNGVKVIMPIIDFFNHRMGAQGFKISAVPAPPSMRIQAVPDPETGELFVRYNVFDTLDTYLYYGFVDQGVGYLSSVPCTLQIGETTLKVDAGGGQSKLTKLPPAIKDLRLFIPSITKTTAGDFAASKLVIPGPKAPRALRRVLTVLLNTLQVPKTKMADTLRQAEQDLLAQNETWWTDLAQKCAQIPKENTIHTLCENGLAHIAQYRAIQAKMDAD